MVCTHIAEVVWSLSPGCLILRFVYKFSFSRGLLHSGFLRSMPVSIPIFTSPASAAKATSSSGSFCSGRHCEPSDKLGTPVSFFPVNSCPILVSASRFPFLVSVSRSRLPCLSFPFLFPVSALVSVSFVCLSFPVPSLAASRFSLLFSASPIPQPSGLPGYFRVNSLLSARPSAYSKILKFGLQNFRIDDCLTQVKLFDDLIRTLLFPEDPSLCLIAVRGCVREGILPVFTNASRAFQRVADSLLFAERTRLYLLVHIVESGQIHLVRDLFQTLAFVREIFGNAVFPTFVRLLQAFVPRRQVSSWRYRDASLRHRYAHRTLIRCPRTSIRRRYPSPSGSGRICSCINRPPVRISRSSVRFNHSSARSPACLVYSTARSSGCFVYSTTRPSACFICSPALAISAVGC